LLSIPLARAQAWFNADIDTPWKVLAWKVGFTIVILFVIYEVILRVSKLIRSYRERGDSMVPDVDASLIVKDTEFSSKLEALHAPEQTIAALKKAKKWAELGQVYTALTRFKDAAWAFRKAGDLSQSAMALAKAGKTVQAAKVLQKIGDHATAGRLFQEKKKFVPAARAFVDAGDLPSAGLAFAKGRRYTDAVTTFNDYFAAGKDSVDRQAVAAEQCYQMLEDPAVQAKVPEEDRKHLTAEVARRFDAAQRNDLAAQLYLKGGDFVRAGEVFLRMGRLEDAGRCMQQAGRTKEAAEIGGRFYESKERWKEAALAYEGAGHYKRAGDCWSKMNDARSAARCYEQAGEFFGSGFALVHAKEWESAIRMFQSMREDNPNFAQSRALLGRCFYELGDYAHCAATLENHLTGDKVTSTNIDYFWMLALAYEQLGELIKSRDTLLKIRTVQVGFRDVSQRLSNIETRISMSIPSAAHMPSGVSGGTGGDAAMTMVAASIGPRYALEKELGRGGMGVVYLARDMTLDRPVALKFLGALVDGSNEYKARFQREAKAAAKVTHPNIVSIYDIGTQEGKAYIAMEYVEGINLYQYIQRNGKLDAREAVNIMGQACAALDAVHQVGIIHRDIKPENIFIAKGGLVKLMDFGLAKSTDMRLTAANTIMGTPSYMAPEQARGQDADARTDVYALGLVLHEMLTGETVFRGEDVLKRQVTEMPPPPGEKVEGVPQLLDQIVMKCIQKKPEERFQSVQEFASYLRQVTK
jgi:tetratricopeptide (TPR) repeat protein/predicted Ser/Thr protein kinase